MTEILFYGSYRRCQTLHYDLKIKNNYLVQRRPCLILYKYCRLKFRLSEKTTKLTLLIVTSKLRWRYRQIFAAFLENLSFMNNPLSQVRAAELSLSNLAKWCTNGVSTTILLSSLSFFCPRKSRQSCSKKGKIRFST